MGEVQKVGFSLEELGIDEWDDINVPVTPLSLTWFLARFCPEVTIDSVQVEGKES